MLIFLIVFGVLVFLLFAGEPIQKAKKKKQKKKESERFYEDFTRELENFKDVKATYWLEKRWDNPSTIELEIIGYKRKTEEKSEQTMYYNPALKLPMYKTTYHDENYYIPIYRDENGTISYGEERTSYEPDFLGMISLPNPDLKKFGWHDYIMHFTETEGNSTLKVPHSYSTNLSMVENHERKEMSVEEISKMLNIPIDVFALS